MNSSQQVRRPLVGVALSIVGGLAVQRGLDLPVFLMMGLSACSLALLAGVRRFRSSAGIYAAAFVLAAAYGAVESVRTPAGAALPVAEVLTTQQEVAGTVVGDPEVFDADDAVVFRFRVEAVRFDDGWRRADLTVRARIRGVGVVPAYGERWQLTGRFRSYETSFSGIYGAFYCDSAGAVRLREASPSFRALCYQTRRRAASVLRRGMNDFPDQAQLLQALLLGYRHELPEQQHQMFARTGTLHIFAISGLHVGVMAAILIAVLKMTGVSKPRWGLFLIPLLFFYVVSTGMKPSAFRAFTMAAVYFSAPLLPRRADTPSALAMAAIILLAVNPLQLSDPGFLLSFTVVCGIIMVHQFAACRIRGMQVSGRAAWSRLRGPVPLAAFGRTVGLLALTSLAAWLFSVPLTARFFNTFSPVALGGNLVIIPLTFMIVLTGCLSLLAAPFSFAAPVVFNHANRIFITLLMALIQRIGEVPGAYCFVRAPAFAAMVGWYGGLVLLFVGSVRFRKGALLLLLCTVAFGSVDRIPSRAQAGVEVFRDADVCVLLREGGDPQALSVKADAYGLMRAARFLKKKGINRLPVLVLNGSRVDMDAVQELCGTFSVEQVWLPHGSAEEARGLNGSRVGFSDRPGVSAGDGTVWLETRR